MRSCGTRPIRCDLAFTLIEMLCVVMLLGLIASVLVVSLVRADTAGTAQSAMWQFVILDAHARLTSRANDRGCMLSIEHDGGELRLNDCDEARTLLSDVELPASATIRFLHETSGMQRPAASLFIDRNGQSADAIVELQLESVSQRRWQLNGLTGQITRFDDPIGVTP